MGVTGLLTDVELAAVDLTGQLARLVRQIIGDGPNAAADCTEAAHRIHAVQDLILAQAAARAYPERYRLLGGGDPPPGNDEPPGLGGAS